MSAPVWGLRAARDAGTEHTIQIFNQNRKIAQLLIVVDEIENLVFLDRPRDGPAKLLTPLIRPDGCQRVTRLKVLIAIVIKSVRMEQVSA